MSIMDLNQLHIPSVVNPFGGGGNLIASQLLLGITATGNSGAIVGTMVNHTGIDSVAGSTAGTGGGTIYARPTPGYYSGSEGVTVFDANHIPSNILSGITDFGVTGTAINGVGMKNFATGTITSSSGTTSYTNVGGTNNACYTVSVSGLSFIPTTIIIFSNSTVNSCAPTSFYRLGIGYSASGGWYDTSIGSNYNFASSVTTSFTLPVSNGSWNYKWIAYGA